MGPQVFSNKDVYLRTAVSTEPGGWSQFGHVKMPDYRWGIFLSAREQDRVIPGGDHAGKPVWQEVPGEYRNALKRIIVVQADTEPASVEQQRFLADTAPSLYDCRNLFQVNVEEGRHLWAMVYLLQAYFGRDGREEADALLARRSGNEDTPRILDAFNQPCEDWLTFFSFTTFTDRDGKYQLGSLAESAFDPLSRTCKFMLTEEAHHMFVGESGMERILRRSVELSKEAPNGDARESGASTSPRSRSGSTIGTPTRSTSLAPRSPPMRRITSRLVQGPLAGIQAVRRALGTGADQDHSAAQQRQRDRGGRSASQRDERSAAR